MQPRSGSVSLPVRWLPRRQEVVLQVQVASGVSPCFADPVAALYAGRRLLAALDRAGQAGAWEPTDRLDVATEARRVPVMIGA